METIDIHSHFLPETWPDLATRFGTPDWPWLKRLDHDRGMQILKRSGSVRIHRERFPVAVREDISMRRP